MIRATTPGFAGTSRVPPARERGARGALWWRHVAGTAGPGGCGAAGRGGPAGRLPRAVRAGRPGADLPERQLTRPAAAGHPGAAADRPGRGMGPRPGPVLGALDRP